MKKVRRKASRVARAATVEAWLVLVAIVATVWLFSSGTLAHIVEASAAFQPLPGFIAGLLYSTFVTTPIAIGAFVAVADTTPIWQTASLGAFGAAMVDLVLIDSTRSPLMKTILDDTGGPRLRAVGRQIGRIAKSPWRWLTAVFGAFLIAIPLPTDEVGLTFMGIANLRTLQMIPIIFVADFIGIYALVSTIQTFTA